VTAPTIVQPAYFTHPPYTITDGPDVCELAAIAGLAPDPEQELALDAMFAVDPTRKTLKGDMATSAFAFGIVCARQNMKTGLLKQAALGWLFVTHQELVVWSAHEMDTTREAFEDLINLIEGCPMLRKRLAPGPTDGIHRGSGVEMIRLAPTARCPHGQRIKFKARTHGGGRGLTGNKVVLDEAMYLQKSHMGSLLPTLSAVNDPQVVYAGSAGMATSEVWRGVRDRGRAGGDPSLAYMEFCSQPEEGACQDELCSHALEVEGCALDDIEYLRQSNPALDRRITVSYLLAERRELPPEEYGRERAGWWDKPEGVADPLISADMWKACEDKTSQAVDPVSFGVYVSSDRTSSAIGMVGRRADGRYHVGIVPAVRGKKIDTLPGTLWIPGRLKELKESWKPCAVVIDGHSGAASLINAIEEEGVDVTVSNSTDLTLACGNFYDAVKPDEAGVIHMFHRGATPLFRAVTGAKKRELTATDNWVWDRKDKDADITQLMAVTLALHGLTPTPYNLLESVW
jgi:hypothetical protein